MLRPKSALGAICEFTGPGARAFDVFATQADVLVVRAGA
jgi:hypothetical protein